MGCKLLRSSFHFTLFLCAETPTDDTFVDCLCGHEQDIHRHIIDSFQEILLNCVNSAKSLHANVSANIQNQTHAPFIYKYGEKKQFSCTVTKTEGSGKKKKHDHEMINKGSFVCQFLFKL